MVKFLDRVSTWPWCTFAILRPLGVGEKRTDRKWLETSLEAVETGKFGRKSPSKGKRGKVTASNSTYLAQIKAVQ